MRAGGVEVAQQGGVPFADFLFVLAGLSRIVALCLDGVGDCGLDGGLCAPVDIGRADGTVFGDWNHVGDARRVAVDGGRRGEDNVVDIVLDHGREEGNGAADVDAVVCEGNLSRLADSLGPMM